MTPVKDRVKAYRKAQAEKGLVEIRVWVPVSSKDYIKQVADRIRGKYLVNRRARCLMFNVKGD